MRLEWLSRDNLLSPPFALVTYMVSFYKTRSEIQGKITGLLRSWGHNHTLNVEVMALTSSIYDHFIIWPSSVTLTFNLLKQMIQVALLLLKENTSAQLFWNPCINVEVMARTSSIYDHFLIWPSSVTLTFNLPKQMFQMALLLLKENTCAKLFWHSCTKCRSYGPDKLYLWAFYHMTFKCVLDPQPTKTTVSNGTTTPQGEHMCKIILKSMHKCRSQGISWRKTWET